MWIGGEMALSRCLSWVHGTDHVTDCPGAAEVRMRELVTFVLARRRKGLAQEAYSQAVPAARVLVSVPVIALLSLLIGVAPTHAITASITCPGTVTTVYDNRTLTVSDVLEISASSCNSFIMPAAAAGSANYGGITYGPGSTVAYAGGVVTYIPPPGRMRGSVEIEFRNGTGGVVFYLTVTATDTSSQMWFQSVGRTVGEKCEAGWSPSWEQWPNSGLGGFTCNREVVGIGGHVYPTFIGNPGVG